MIRRSLPSSPPRHRAVTLIEVVLGLVILAVLVSSVTLARSRFLLQAADARSKQAAVQAADRLIASWLASETDQIPPRAQGILEENLTWRTTPINDPAAKQLNCMIVRLQVNHGQRQILTIDLLKQIPPMRAREGT